MKKQEHIDDPFLSALVKKITIEEPAGNFTDLVMKQIEALAETQPQRSSLLRLFNKAFPWFMLTVITVGLLLVYQLVYFDVFPAGSYYKEELFPLISRSFHSFFQLFSSKFVLIALTVIFSGMIYWFLERWYSHRQTDQHILLF